DESQPTGTQVLSGQNGCDSLQINITAAFNTVQLNAQAEQPVCEGLPGRIILENVTGGSPPYRYSLNGEGGQAA
ncbi:MAG: hypothetical protein GVY26_11060, partial [Bacteroidetes bacterium]|nr:hypothetical protein [Bacteroidota bacterium]